MHVTRRLVEYTSLGIILLTTLAGVLVYPQLPDQMANPLLRDWHARHVRHANTRHHPPPAIMLLTLLFLHWMPQLDPRANIHILHVTTIGTMLLLAVVQGVVLTHNLGYDVPFDRLLAGIFAWAVVISGYAFYQERG